MAVHGFLRRWAVRKAESGKTRARPDRETARGEARPPVAGHDQAVAHTPHLPTMEDVKHLTQDSDYSLFVARDTDPAVRRAAMKTLFSDPHFNRMDGLDIYIDDYNRYEPLTPAMLAALQHARGMLQGGEDASAAASDAAPPSQDGAEERPGGDATNPSESRNLPPAASTHR